MKSKPKAQDTKEEIKSPNYTNVILAILLAITSWITFSSAFDHDFVSWDDPVYVQEEPLVLNKEYSKFWSTPISLNYHPITMLSLAWQVNKGKEVKAQPFVKGNVVLHSLNTILVFLLVLSLTNGTSWIAFFTALLFCIHPTRVESVVWVSERKDVLYTFFFLLSCLSYIKYLKSSKTLWWISTYMLFVLSILSKSVAVVLPLVFLLLDYWFTKDIDAKKVINKIPFFIVSLIFGLIAIDIQAGGNFYGWFNTSGERVSALANAEVFTLWQRLQIGSYGFIHYIIDFVWPSKLCTFHPYPSKESFSTLQFVVYPFLFVGILGSSFYFFKKCKTAFFSILFYFVTVVLVLQFLSVGLVIKAERYTYIPYIGLAFLLFSIIWKFIGGNKNKIIGASIALSLMAMFRISQTRSQVDTWQNSESLWSQVLKYYPNEDYALGNRGNSRGKSGNIQGAMADFELAIKDGCKVANVYEGLGNVYGVSAMKDATKAVEYRQKSVAMYDEAIKLDPNKSNTHYNKGITLLSLNPNLAAQSIQKAIEINQSKKYEFGESLALAYVNSSNFQLAIQKTNEIIQAGKANDKTYFYQGLAYQGLGDNANAAKSYQSALAINPNNVEVKNRLGLK